MAIYIYAPTVLFAILGTVQLFRGRLWPAAAFAMGLVATGLFHQQVVGDSYGNPGYMIPAGHIAAPLVSGVAYAVCFLGAWALVRVWKRREKGVAQ